MVTVDLLPLFWAGSSIASGILLVLISFLIKRIKDKKYKEKLFERNGGQLLQRQLLPDKGITERKVFTAKELEKATDHFNKNRVIGQGGQGTVYKGMLSDGRIVAVKKAKLENENQVRHFVNEVVILSQINHKNIVKLLGCCLETEVPLLVYEFVSNGNLSDHIQGDVAMSWDMRLKIAAEAAGAIAYLHCAMCIAIYHRDIKSSNILLDEKYTAKVADFGISRNVSADQTHLTTLVKGTFGYFDPEYFQSNKFTEKSDVYSFGVVLLELLTGQKPISGTKNEGHRGLAMDFMMAVEENSLEKFLDARIMHEGDEQEVLAVAELARRCLNLNSKSRPTMKQVAAQLEGIMMSKLPSHVQTEVIQESEGVHSRSGEESSWTDLSNSFTDLNESIV